MQRNAFTLVELAIVLVIIGLLVGGVLVGRDLIKASEIRATVTQIDKYNAAVNTFRLKYGQLPGDMSSTKAQMFGFFYVTTGAYANTYGYGNADGLITGMTSVPQGYAGEVVMFWLHLCQAKLIEGGYGFSGPDVMVVGATPTGGSTTTRPMANVDATTTDMINKLIPAARLGNNNSIIALSDSGVDIGSKNYYILSGITTLQANGQIYATNNLTPMEAYTIDEKIDDGIPATGKVFALDTVANMLFAYTPTPIAQGITTASANNCVNGGKYYRSNSSFAEQRNCSLRFDFQ